MNTRLIGLASLFWLALSAFGQPVPAFTAYTWLFCTNATAAQARAYLGVGTGGGSTNWVDTGSTNSSLSGDAYAHSGHFTNALTLNGVNVLTNSVGGSTNQTSVGTNDFWQGGISADNGKFTNNLTFPGTNTAGLILRNLTTAQLANLPTPPSGAMAFNTDSNRFMAWDDSAWHQRVRLDGDTMYGALSILTLTPTNNLVGIGNGSTLVPAIKGMVTNAMGWDGDATKVINGAGNEVIPNSSGYPGQVLTSVGQGSAAILTNINYLPGWFTNGQVGIVAIGDSIIAGYAATHPVTYYLTNQSYLPATWSIHTNGGVAGYTILQIGSVWTNYILAAFPIFQPGNNGTNEVLMLQGGINSLANGIAATTVFLTFSNICKSAHANGFYVMAWTCTPDAIITEAQEAQRLTYNRLIRESPGMWDYLLDTDGIMPGPPSDAVYLDFVHFNDAGLQILARDIAQVFQRPRWSDYYWTPKSRSATVNGNFQYRNVYTSFKASTSIPGLMLEDTGTSSVWYQDNYSSSLDAYFHTGAGNVVAADKYQSVNSSGIHWYSAVELGANNNLKATQTVPAVGGSGTNIVVNFASLRTFIEGTTNLNLSSYSSLPASFTNSAMARVGIHANGGDIVLNATVTPRIENTSKALSFPVTITNGDWIICNFEAWGHDPTNVVLTTEYYH